PVPPCSQTGTATSFTPTAWQTFASVSNRGLAPGRSALYRLSRPSPDASAISAMPRALATCPSARSSSSVSPSASTCDRYSAIASSLSSRSAISKGCSFAFISCLLRQLLGVAYVAPLRCLVATAQQHYQHASP